MKITRIEDPATPSAVTILIEHSFFNPVRVEALRGVSVLGQLANELQRCETEYLKLSRRQAILRLAIDHIETQEAPE